MFTPRLACGYHYKHLSDDIFMIVLVNYHSYIKEFNNKIGY